MNRYTAVEKCRICKNTSLVKVVDLGTQTLTGVFPSDPKQAITRGPIQLVKCHGDHACGLLQMAHSYDLGEMYGLNYGYRSGLNASMVEHLRGKVLRLLEIVKLQPGDLVIDIGSNDCTTLKFYGDLSVQAVGVDPTGVKFKDFYPPNVDLIPDFFSASLVKNKFPQKKAKVVTSFSMFYDLESPVDFAADVTEILDENGIWVFEQSYMPKMLETNSFDTACHEHLEYYGLKQIKWIMDKVGLKVVDVEFNDINGGSFSITAAKRESSFTVFKDLQTLIEQEKTAGLDGLEPYKAFQRNAEKTKLDLLAFLRTAKAENKRVAALGASTKGNVLLQFAEINNDLIYAVGEVNEEKFGRYTPGTLIPIVPENELLSEKPDYLLVLPWHFRNFFEQNAKFKNSTLVFPLPYVSTSKQ